MRSLSKQFLFLLCTGLLLAACHPTDMDENQSDNLTVSQDVTINKEDYIGDDGQVLFKENISLLSLNNKDKKKVYKALDKIENYSGDKVIPPLEMSNIAKIENHPAYEDIIKASYDAPQLIYIGFDACPYCRVFLPKLNQLAKELTITYHYYNTDERLEDDNFHEVVDNFFKISTVPQLFLIEDGKVADQLMDSNSMEELENFLIKHKS